MKRIIDWLKAHDWRDDFDVGALKRGSAYTRQNRVRVLSLEDERILSMCEGSGDQEYRQSIFIGKSGKQLHAACNCPVGLNCKHAVAVIEHVLNANTGSSKGPAQGLSKPLQEWLHRLPQVRASQASAYPEGETSRLYYQVTPDTQAQLYKVRLSPDGALADVKPYNALRDAIARQPRFLLPVDLRIARLALGGSDYRYGNSLSLEGELGAELLPLIISTGRAVLDLETPEPLVWHAPLKASFRWSQTSSGEFRQEWEVSSASEIKVLTSIAPLHYMDLDQGRVGLLDCDQPPELASHLSRMPAVPESQAEAFGLALGNLAPDLPKPRPLPRRDVDDIDPVPYLTLGSHLHTNYDTRSARMVSQPQHRAGLAFRYAGALVHGKPQRDTRVQVRSGDEYLSIARQLKVEQAYRSTLQQAGFNVALRQSQALPANSAEMFEMADDKAWLSFVENELPTLRAQGWEVDIRPGFNFDLTPVEKWYANIDEAPGHEWFDLELGIVIDGQRISLLPVLLGLIRRNPGLLSTERLQQRDDEEQIHLQIDARRDADGRPTQVMLPFGRLKPLLSLLGDIYMRDAVGSQAELRLEAPDAARLSELAGLPLEWEGGTRVREFAQRLQDYDGRDVEPPTALGAELRPYQREGLAWMQTLRHLQVGGILGDDMGLGKTLQTLAHLLLEKQAGRLDAPCLVVMPTTLIPNWQDEAARFTPDLRVMALHGPQRQREFGRLQNYDLLLTTYSLLPRDIATLRSQHFHVVVFDEAQNLKNPASKAAQAARQLKARQRLCLSGTPLENHLGELWALFDLLMPGWLGDSKRFAQDYRTPIEKQGDVQRLEHLRARIKPFLLRRRKEQVARELPAKNEFVHWVELTEAQRDHYETVRLAMDKKVRDAIQNNGLARSQIVILDALLKLRQVCCDLRLLADGSERKSTANSGKLSSLMEMLDELLTSGRRVLLFSQFTSMLALIEEELKKRSQPYLILTGDTHDRRTPVQRFQNNEVPIFLISLKAGGTGLNLTAADTVIHYDPWWNPAVENQATDRAYRIGQDKPVFVYKLIARGTVEERIQQLQQRKSDLAKGLLESTGEGEWRLHPDDINALFAPLP
jgi:superfamily II DNA or RNA helicase